MVSALWTACDEGDVERVRALLVESSSVEIEIKDHSGATPLIQAVKGGHIDVVKALLDVGADPFNRAAQGPPENHTSNPAIVQLIQDARDRALNQHSQPPVATATGASAHTDGTNGVAHPPPPGSHMDSKSPVNAPAPTYGYYPQQPPPPPQQQQQTGQYYPQAPTQHYPPYMYIPGTANMVNGQYPYYPQPQQQQQGAPPSASAATPEQSNPQSQPQHQYNVHAHPYTPTDSGVTPTPTTPGSHLPPEVAKTIPCRFYPSCRYGATCHFAHPQAPYTAGPLPPPAEYGTATQVANNNSDGPSPMPNGVHSSVPGGYYAPYSIPQPGSDQPRSPTTEHSPPHSGNTNGAYAPNGPIHQPNSGPGAHQHPYPPMSPYGVSVPYPTYNYNYGMPPPPGPPGVGVNVPGYGVGPSPALYPTSPIVSPYHPTHGHTHSHGRAESVNGVGMISPLHALTPTQMPKSPSMEGMELYGPAVQVGPYGPPTQPHGHQLTHQNQHHTVPHQHQNTHSPVQARDAGHARRHSMRKPGFASDAHRDRDRERNGNGHAMRGERRSRDHCMFFPMGKCRNGDNCPWQHIMPENIPNGTGNGFPAVGPGRNGRNHRFRASIANVNGLEERMGSMRLENGSPKINGTTNGHANGAANGTGVNANHTPKYPSISRPPQQNRAKGTGPSAPRPQRIPTSDDFPALGGSSTPPPAKLSALTMNGRPTAAQVLQAPAKRRELVRSNSAGPEGVMNGTTGASTPNGVNGTGASSNPSPIASPRPTDGTVVNGEVNGVVENAAVEVQVSA